MQPAFIAASPVRPAVNHALATNNHAALSPRQPTAPKWTMAKVAKFGPFTPAVLLTKVVLGDKQLNKIRGKAIALHSQAITAFCEFTGAGPKMRQALIRQAKDNGNTLGFLS